MNQLQSNNKGFSLIELLVSLAIAGFVVVSAFTVVTYGIQMFGKSNKETKIQSEVQFTGNAIGDLIKTGNSSSSYIVVNKDLSGGVIDMYIYPSAQLDAVGNIDHSATTSTKQYIYYNKDRKSVYIYEGYETVNLSNEEDLKQHLVSKYIEGFDAKYIQTKKDEVVNEDIYPEDDVLDMYASDSNVINVEIDYEMLDKTRSTSISYKIRNK